MIRVHIYCVNECHSFSRRPTSHPGSKKSRSPRQESQPAYSRLPPNRSRRRRSRAQHRGVQETFRSRPLPRLALQSRRNPFPLTHAAKTMPARSFFDTNVLIYADDKAAPAKQRRALELVAEHRRAGTGVVSLQVLQEYFVTVTRKLQVDARIARRKVELLAEFDVAAPDLADILAAIDLHRLHGFSFWDALVVRAAKQAGCSVLFSEDLQQQREIDGVRIVNPFRVRDAI